MYELTVYSNITYSYVPFYHTLFLISLAFGITIGDPGGCHVIPELGRDTKGAYINVWSIKVHIYFVARS